jgi:RNA polymerase sigma-70 factor, ECF subfamily
MARSSDHAGGEREDRPGEPLSRGERFMRLFLRAERRVYGLIVAMTGSWSDADDILQETTSVMWRKFDDFKPGTDFNAWALSVARFQVMAWRKRRAIHRKRLSDQTVEALADQVASAPDHTDVRREALRQCLAKLNDRDRQLIELRYEPGATTQSAADQVGRSIHAVYKALNRIHGALLQCIRRALAAEGVRV